MATLTIVVVYFFTQLPGSHGYCIDRLFLMSIVTGA